MTLTATKNLETLCPVDNLKVVIIATDNQFSTAGINAELYFKFYDKDETPGSNLVFGWNGKIITMVFCSLCFKKARRAFIIWISLENEGTIKFLQSFGQLEC